MLVDLHDSSLVTASVAIVGRAENGDHVPILTPIVALHHQLMSSCNQRQAVVVIERFADILSKRVSRSSRRYPPTTSVVWVGPQQIAHGSFMRHFLDTVETANVVESIDRWGETAVQTEDLIVDQSGEWQVVEEVGEVFPDVGVAVFAEAFVVEAVDLGDLAGFVVTAEDGDSRWVADLEGHEQGYCFYGVVASVYVVA